jgi:hypothetical protein
MIKVVPLTVTEANAHVKKHHTHHDPVQGGLFAVGVEEDGRLVCVAIAGRPVARALVGCLEVTRVASDGTTKNAASKALGAIMRAAAALGYKRLVSYTLATEAGTSYKACGWHQAAFVRGREWSCPSRKRKPSKQPVDKIRWEWHVKE